MGREENQKQFADDLRAVINRHRHENDLNYADAVGILRLMSAAIEKEWLQRTSDEENERTI